MTQNINNTGFPEQHTLINGSTDGTVGQISYYLDGGTNMTGLRNTGNILPNPDAIREFTVQTANFSAEFGRSSAGFVSVLTKSGTNHVHGSIFEFVRDTALVATTHNGIYKNLTPYHRNQFGATLGGPVMKDKLFFFGQLRRSPAKHHQYSYRPGSHRGSAQRRLQCQPTYFRKPDSLPCR